MGLSFRDVVSTPRRNDRLRRPMLALYRQSVVSLLRAYHITPRPSAALRREAHSATLQHSNSFLPHSLPRLPQLALFACSHGNNLYAMVSLPRVFFAAL